MLSDLFASRGHARLKRRYVRSCPASSKELEGLRARERGKRSRPTVESEEVTEVRRVIMERSLRRKEEQRAERTAAGKGQEKGRGRGRGEGGDSTGMRGRAAMGEQVQGQTSSRESDGASAQSPDVGGEESDSEQASDKCGVNESATAKAAAAGAKAKAKKGRHKARKVERAGEAGTRTGSCAEPGGHIASGETWTPVMSSSGQASLFMSPPHTTHHIGCMSLFLHGLLPRHFEVA